MVLRKVLKGVLNKGLYRGLLNSKEGSIGDYIRRV